jgi:3-oxoacyl-[acyl-carrier-protein] synthase II
MSRFTKFAVYAAEEALEQSGILTALGSTYRPERVGVVVSSGIGGFETIQEEHDRGRERDMKD